jgi:hypothetical protein
MPEKTAQELIAELDRISGNGKGLLILYRKRSRLKSYLLYSTDPDRVETLTLAIRSGGKPFAWFAVYDDSLHFELLPDYKGQAWAKRDLETLIKKGVPNKNGPLEGIN